jgi:[ribosomal protein S18]-alanine N-acetyltransferase
VAADAAELARLEEEIFGAHAWSAQAVEAELKPDEANRAFALVDGEEVVAYVFLRTSPDVADLLRIGVRASMRRRGAGSRLMAAAIELARTRGCVRMLLEVAADNAPALTFYRRLGFRPIDRRPGYYRDAVDAFVLQKHL